MDREIIAEIRLAPGEVGYYDDYSRIYLNAAKPTAYIYAGTNTTQIRRSIRSGRLRLVSGSLFGPAKPKQEEPVKKEEKKPVSKPEPKVEEPPVEETIPEVPAEEPIIKDLAPQAEETATEEEKPKRRRSRKKAETETEE